MKINIINHGYETAPRRAHYNDAGADVYATETIILNPQQTYAMNLKFGLKLPDGLMALVLPRSGQAKNGLVSQIPPVDSGYTGPIHAILTNNSKEPIIIDKGDRIAQVVVMPFIVAEFTEEEHEQRGEGRFNSTGK